jgi:hypothetical protein
MKKSWFLALTPLIVLASGCSLIKNNETKPVLNEPVVNAQGNVCAIPVVASSSEVNVKTGLPPVSQEEKKKTFTYEDEEMGVKMKYPGSCYFNKGIFQCSDFTLSIWLLDDGSKVSATPEKSFANNQTQLKYTYSHNKQVYALMAWYDGKNKTDLEKMIDNIAKSLTFTR